MILLKCDCGKTLQAPDGTSAKKGKCPHCGQLLPLPQLAQPTAQHGIGPHADFHAADERLPHMIKAMPGHRGPIRCVKFSPDGRLLATAAGSEGGSEAGKQKFGEIRIWDAQSGRQLASMQGHLDTVLSAVFTDDETLVSGSKDHTLVVWDVSHGLHGVVLGLKVHTLRGHTGRVSSLAMTPDGSLLASASDDGTIRLWEVGSWRLLDTMTTGRGGLCQLAVSPDGSLLAAVWRSRGPTMLWDLATRQEFLKLSLPREEDAEDFDLAFSPDGSLLAVLSASDVRLWDLSSCQVLVDIDAVGVRSLAFSPDGKTLATAGFDAKTDYCVQLWDTMTGDELERLPGHENSIYVVGFSPDGRRLASGGRDLAVRLWAV